MLQFLRALILLAKFDESESFAQLSRSGLASAGKILQHEIVAGDGFLIVRGFIGNFSQIKIGVSREMRVGIELDVVVNSCVARSLFPPL